MYLHAIGHFHPENVLTNAFFQELGIQTDEQWITERVGIVSRHTVLPLDYIRQTHNQDVRAADEAALYSNAETSSAAAQMALARAGLKAADIGMVIAGGCSPDECIPAAACRIAEALEIDAPALDINSACSSFCAQAHFLDSMRPERLPDFVLVVNPENNTRVVDYRDRSSCVLWGDGTTAAIFSPRIPGPWKLTYSSLRGDPSGADKVRVPRVGHFTQQGAAVQTFAIKRSVETFLAMRDSWSSRNPAHNPSELTFIGHQANLRMLESVARRAEVPARRHFHNVGRRGNTGAAGAPSVLSENWENAQLGDAVGIVVVGSGLTWSGIVLERQRP